MQIQVVDHPGYGPDSTYVKWFWTPKLGPTASLLWSRLLVEAQLDTEFDPVEIGKEIGVGRRTVQETMNRLRYFGIVSGDDPIAVRNTIGPVREPDRLPRRLAAMHASIGRRSA